MKDSIAVRVFKDNQLPLGATGSHWEMKLCHLGTLGATLPFGLPPGPGRMEDGTQRKPGLLLPGHPELALKGVKESVGSLLPQVCTCMLPKGL